ncbi:MAG: rod shape-determining protein MreC, partial [Flavobacteriales bacterium]|nr:rod shape-determining protein MreC [Flavobacteriales bacterium]
VLAFYLPFKNNHFQRSSILNSTNRLSGGLYMKYAQFDDYLHLKEVNDALSDENRRLRESSIESFERLFGENIIIKDTVFRRKYSYAKAKIINNTVHRQNNYLTLNIGILNGLESGMGVIGPNGVVGMIKNVSNNYASVVSVLHGDSKISVKLKNTKYFGSMQWDGSKYDYRHAKLKDIPNHVYLTIGDTVITSGYSSTFPEGIATAVVTSFEGPEGDNFYAIDLELLNDFKQLSYVYVIKNNTILEQQLLEKEMKEEDD